MAIGVDTSKWKPRKLIGTPAGVSRNYLAAAIISFGVVWGAFYQFSGITSKYRKALEVLYEDPIEEVERKQMIAAGLPNRTAEGLRKLVEKSERPDLPEK